MMDWWWNMRVARIISYGCSTWLCWLVIIIVIILFRLAETSCSSCIDAERNWTTGVKTASRCYYWERRHVVEEERSAVNRNKGLGGFYVLYQGIVGTQPQPFITQECLKVEEVGRLVAPLFCGSDSFSHARRRTLFPSASTLTLLLNTTMPNTNIQTGQDWGTVNVGRASAGRVSVPKTAHGVTRAKAMGLVATVSIIFVDFFFSFLFVWFLRWHSSM